MGWELRHDGKMYLYRNRRVNGKPVKEYLAAADDFGTVMADDLERLQRHEREVRNLTRQARADRRAGIDEVLKALSSANDTLRTIAVGILRVLGYHQHHRGEWRMKRELASLKTILDTYRDRASGPTPLVRFTPPADDAEAVDVFQKARAGDAIALDRVHALIRDRKWLSWLGDIGRQATNQLVQKAAAGDPVWEAGLIEKVNALRREMLGECPTVLEELLVRRVVNGWVAVHALELELTLRPPTDTRDRAHLDAALSRAQRRMTEAIGELARVRRLQAPKILAHVSLTATQRAVNEGAVQANNVLLARPMN